jgi:hypothetical protein
VLAAFSRLAAAVLPTCNVADLGTAIRNVRPFRLQSARLGEIERV